MDAITVKNLKFGYGAKTVVDIADFRLEAQQSIAVIGPSGCGKSTFMHLLAGLLRFDSGEILVEGQSLADLSDAQMDKFRGRSIGLVLQRFHLIRSISIRQNLLLAHRLSGSAMSSKSVDAAIEQLGIGEIQHQRPNEVSYGQAQRAAIARAVLHRPKLVLADEPTSALDDDNATAAIQLLKEAVSESGAALMVVTHDQRVRGALDRDYDFGGER
ncbi:MAG: ATP-binding cassette domain-containing protein [Pseudomonadota bacterium]